MGFERVNTWNWKKNHINKCHSFMPIDNLNKYPFALRDCAIAWYWIFCGGFGRFIYLWDLCRTCSKTFIRLAWKKLQKLLFRWNITYISNFFIKTLKKSWKNRIDDWIHTDAFATKGIEPDIKCRVTLNCIFMWIFLFKMCDYGSQCFHSVFMNEGKCHSSALSIQSVKIRAWSCVEWSNAAKRWYMLEFCFG